MSTSKVMNINLWNIPGKFEFVSNDRTLNLSTTSILLRTETTECDDLHKCEKWRRQIIGEVSRKVAQIQNGNQF
jgi:hypothetical protein